MSFTLVYKKYSLQKIRTINVKHIPLHKFILIMVSLYGLGRLCLAVNIEYYKDIQLLLYISSLFFSVFVISKILSIKYKKIYLILLVLFVCGVLKDNISNKTSSFFSFFQRHSFGFLSPFVLANAIVYLYMYKVICSNKISLFRSILFEFLTIVCFIFCDSRNAFIGQHVLFFLLLLDRIIPHIFYKRIIYYISVLIFPLISCIGLIFLLRYQYRDDFIMYVDHLISGRLTLTFWNIEINPICFFKIMDNDAFINTVPYTVDSGYYYLLLRYGGISLVIFTFINYKIATFFFCKENYIALNCLIVILLMSFIDNAFNSFCYIPFLLIGITSYLPSSFSER